MRYPVGGKAFVPLLLLALGGVAGAAGPVGSDLVVNGLAMDGEEEREGGFAPLVESGQRKWVVRFSGPIREEEKERVQKLGCLLHDYLPDFAFVATMDDVARKEVAKLPFVSQVMRFRPEHKLPAKLREKPAKKSVRGAGETVTVHLKLDGPESLHNVLSAVQLEYGQVLDVGRDSLRIAVEEAVLPALAAREEVVWINEDLPMELHNDTSRWVIQSNTPGDTRIWDKGIRGEGEIIAIGDTGLDYDMPWFRDPTGVPIGLQHRKVIGYDTTYGDDYDANSPGHGTHVSGTAGGDRRPVDGLTDASGMAPGSRLFIQDLTLGGSNYVNPPNDLGSLFGVALDAGARLHTNSWGNSDTSYGPLAASADRFLWEHKEFLTIFSNGNAGPGEGTTGNPATAKNVVSVGASYNGSSAEDMAAFSSNGPTSDGRIKPTVTAPGYAIVSADSDGLKGSLNSGTTSMSGTSMAAPAVAGAAALVRQYFAQGYYPFGVANPAQVMIPSAALVKAALINSAQNMSGVFTDGPIPSTGQGWGRINLANALPFQGDSRKLEVSDETAGLTTGGNWSRTFFADGTQPLKVTLVWTDYPGATGAAKALVNDLDLAVTAPDGTVYLGNSFIGGVSVAGGGPDRLNVEEQVLVGNPPAGEYTVGVSGYNIPFGPQPFALVVTGGGMGSSMGTISLDKRFYTSGGTLKLTLVDLDLNLDPAVAETVMVQVVSGTEPGGEMVGLTENGTNRGLFTGTLPLASPGGAGEGLLVVSGDTVRAIYLDANDGTGQGRTVSTEALVDDAAPLFSTPEVTGMSDTGATVSWSTNEPADTLLVYGPTPDKGGTVGDGRLAQTHTVNLSGLKEAATYYASAGGTDEAGNRGFGTDFTFTTRSLPPYLTVGSSEGSPTTSPSTIISGVTRDASGVVLVTINGAAAGYRPSDGYYSLTMPLQTGINTFAVTAVDSLGNSASVALTVTRLSAPDLLMTGVSGPAAIRGGEPVQMTSSVQASPAGGAASGFYVHLYLSGDSTCTTGDSILGSRYVPGLATGATSTAETQVTIPLGLLPGSYYFCAIADRNDSVKEENEGNNALTGNSTTYLGADLVMTAVGGPASVKGGESVQVTSSVRAVPTGSAAPGFYVHLFLSSDGTCTTGDALLGARYVSGLAAGATSTAATQVTVPPGLLPGSYYYCAIADRYNAVKEDDEGNNALTGNGTAYVGPDLVMTGVGGPASVRSGESVQVTSSVQASPLGGAASGFYVHLFLSADSSCTAGDTLLGSRYVSGLAAGATSTAGTQATVPLGLLPGSYYFCAIADRYDNVKEENEGNNALTGNFTAYVGADLVMAGVSGPASVKGGESVQVTSSAQASPLGGAASGFYVHLFLSADSSCTTGDTFLGVRYVSGLAAGATSTGGTQVTVPPGLATGSYYFCAIADRYDNVKETNEGNNALTGNSTAYVGADLVVSGVSGPVSVKNGESVQVTSSVQASPAGGAASGFYVHLFLSADSSCTSGDTFLGARYVSGLAAGATSTGSTQVTVPAGLATGSYYFCAIADRYDNVKETNEGNNALTGNMTTCTGRI